ncbi:thioredoxin [Anaeromicropila herbilytica]|uniref:Thioredoxin n=1 Tax=Anaeromicropila herbilytica TaxID=2785025 RepID=A0A7R7EQ44_9FIRM|nr:thioredoxin [Anaeromicropila herbilytica]BCN32447.1 thioredoxin [Anaeromicropila herbilytica]
MNTVKITRDNFEKEVLHSDTPVLLDFWANWCGPCKMLSPTVDEIALEVNDVIKVCKVNIDEEPELASAFHIMSIPTLAVFKNGKVINSSVGVKPKNEILRMLEVK